MRQINKMNRTNGNSTRHVSDFFYLFVNIHVNEIN